MICPACGFDNIGFDNIGLRNGIFFFNTGYKCKRCGFTWFGAERSQAIDAIPVFKFLWASYKVYILQSLLIWIFASAIQFFLVARDPLSAVLSLGDIWLPFALSIVSLGGILGVILSSGILIAGWFWPSSQKIHIFIPLMGAAILGGFQGLLWGKNDFILSLAGISLRDDLTLVISGVLLSIFATPIIIVRSYGILKQKGLRPSLKASEDKRWQF